MTMAPTCPPSVPFISGESLGPDVLELPALVTDQTQTSLSGCHMSYSFRVERLQPFTTRNDTPRVPRSVQPKRGGNKGVLERPRVRNARRARQADTEPALWSRVPATVRVTQCMLKQAFYEVGNERERPELNRAHGDH